MFFNKATTDVSHLIHGAHDCFDQLIRLASASLAIMLTFRARAGLFW